jgi:hypothetical protein
MAASAGNAVAVTIVFSTAHILIETFSASQFVAGNKAKCRLWIAIIPGL